MWYSQSSASDGGWAASDISPGGGGRKHRPSRFPAGQPLLAGGSQPSTRCVVVWGVQAEACGGVVEGCADKKQDPARCIPSYSAQEPPPSPPCIPQFSAKKTVLSTTGGECVKKKGWISLSLSVENISRRDDDDDEIFINPLPPDGSLSFFCGKHLDATTTRRRDFSKKKGRRRRARATRGSPKNTLLSCF